MVVSSFRLLVKESIFFLWVSKRFKETILVICSFLNWYLGFVRDYVD